MAERCPAAAMPVIPASRIASAVSCRGRGSDGHVKPGSRARAAGEGPRGLALKGGGAGGGGRSGLVTASGRLATVSPCTASPHTNDTSTAVPHLRQPTLYGLSPFSVRLLRRRNQGKGGGGGMMARTTRRCRRRGRSWRLP